MGGGHAGVYSSFAVAPIVCGRFVLGTCFILRYFVSFLVWQSSAREEIAGCFTFDVF